MPCKNKSISLKISFIILLQVQLFFSSYVHSQLLNVSGFVKDNDGNPLIYANIASMQKREGTRTDSQGHFSIKLDINDSLKISHISCESKIVPVKSIITNSTIILNISYKNLGDVVIKNNQPKIKPVKLGFYNKDRNGSLTCGPGNQIAVFISNPRKEEAFIKSVSFQIDKKGTCK